MVQSLPATYRYHYRYLGLRLLLMQSGTYYLVPVGWSPQYDLTYILDQSDPIRIELLGAHPLVQVHAVRVASTGCRRARARGVHLH